MALEVMDLGPICLGFRTLLWFRVRGPRFIYLYIYIYIYIHTYIHTYIYVDRFYRALGLEALGFRAGEPSFRCLKRLQRS